MRQEFSIIGSVEEALRFGPVCHARPAGPAGLGSAQAAASPRGRSDSGFPEFNLPRIGHREKQEDKPRPDCTMPGCPSAFGPNFGPGAGSRSDGAGYPAEE